MTAAWMAAVDSRFPSMQSIGLDSRMADVAHSIITTFDYVWDRLSSRLAGLSDDEYLWEPVADCWSLRRGHDGRWRLDGGGGGGPAPQPVSVTTIAWRIGHLGGLALGGFANRRFGDGNVTIEKLDLPGSSAAVGTFLAEHYDAWRGGLAGLDESGWDSPLGPWWGPFAEAQST